MLDVLIQRTEYCKELSSFHEEERSVEKILNYLTASWKEGKRVDALIDCGALLAGTSNIHVAKVIMEEYLITHSSHLQGVTFFNESVKPNGCWMIMDKSGRCLPKDQAPLLESETFSIFDEPRCRGVDLKLDSRAIAILTLGKDMCKDKLMQAAGE